LQSTTASKAGFITGLSVVLVPALSAIILRKLPSPALALGILTATVGLAVLSLSADLIPTSGDLLILLCALSFAFQILAVSRYGSHHDPAVLTTVQIGVVAILSHLAAAGWETWPETVSGPVWQAIFLTGIPATALALLVQNSLQRFTTATHAALVFAAEPVFAAAFAYWLGGETFSVRGYIGAALMLSGMVLAEIAPSDKTSRETPSQA
jgi:drug/metabolite transporter (DMT)-like permease